MATIITRHRRARCSRPPPSAARALGRNDLGKLAAGALADILIIDFGGRQILRYARFAIPSRAWSSAASGDDIDTVIVNGTSAWKMA